MSLIEAQIQETRLDIFHHIDESPDPFYIKDRMRFLTDKLIEYMKQNKDEIYQIDGFLIFRMPLTIRIFGITNKLPKDIDKVQVVIQNKENQYMLRLTYMRDLVDDPDAKVPFVFESIDTYGVDEDALDEESVSYFRLRMENGIAYWNFIEWMDKVSHKKNKKKQRKHHNT